MNIKQKIKDFIAKLKQRLCDHGSNYTEMEYYVGGNCKKTIKRCDECGLGKEKMYEAEKFLLERELPTKSN